MARSAIGPSLPRSARIAVTVAQSSSSADAASTDATAVTEKLFIKIDDAGIASVTNPSSDPSSFLATKPPSSSVEQEKASFPHVGNVQQHLQAPGNPPSSVTAPAPPPSLEPLETPACGSLGVTLHPEDASVSFRVWAPNAQSAFLEVVLDGAAFTPPATLLAADPLGSPPPASADPALAGVPVHVLHLRRSEDHTFAARFEAAALPAGAAYRVRLVAPDGRLLSRRDPYALSCDFNSEWCVALPIISLPLPLPSLFYGVVGSG